MNVTTLIYILVQALEWYSIVVIIRIILSWIPSVLHTMPGQFLAQVVDPALYPFRKILPTPYGMDFSPIALILTLEIIRTLLISLAL